MVRKAKHRIPQIIPTRNKLLSIGGTALVVSLAGIGVTAVASNAAPSNYVVDHQIVSDNFTRVDASGWGAAPTGGAYTLSRAAAFSDAGSAGNALPPRSGTSVTATLGSVSASDVLASDVLTLPVIPAKGNGVYSSLQLRVGGGAYYQAQVRVGSSHNVTLSLLRVNSSTTTQVQLAPETLVARGVEAGQSIDVQFEATGSNPVELSARAWVPSAAMPAWQVTANDSSSSRITQAGNVAVWSYISSATAAQSVNYNQLDAWALKADPTGSSPTPPPTTPTSPTSPTPPPTSPTPPTTTPPAPPTTPPAPPTTGTNPNDPPINLTGVRESAGAAAMGSTAYPIPASAIFVSPSGSDSGSGTLASPFATVAHAISAAQSGETIVLRAGTYHESVTIPANKKLTIQSYPHEQVWFDGSVPLTGWQASGSVWKQTGWNHVFDDSPTYTRGAPDGTTGGWEWINPAYPMAAHPDQLFVNGVSQAQVASLSQVKAGTFYYDTSAQTLYMGSNPSGQQVRASDLVKAITIQSSGSVLRGFGVHRYAPSVPDMGAVTAGAGNTTIENVAFNDNSTTGLSLDGANNTLNDVTAARNGLMGVHTDESDNLKVTGLLAAGNDSEHFNSSPVSGGMKVTRSRNVSVTGSVFLDNLGQGLWMDESVYNMTFVNDDSIGNAADGIVLEISSTAVLANDLVTGNGGDGIKIDDVSSANVWNNTLANNARNLDITEDTRRASNPSDYGHDPRQPFPDPTMTWIDGPIAVHDNVISGGTGDCLLCVEDYSHQYSAAQLKVTSDGNVYQRPSATDPTWAVVWSKGAGNPAVYDTFAEFTAATGQDAHSLELDGTQALSGNQPSPPVTASASTIALPLPGNIASLVGQQVGALHLGAW